MANAKDIKNRIGAVKNIKKITETMEKIATAKSRKATNRLIASRDYYYNLLKLTRHIILFSQEEKWDFLHPLTTPHKSNKNSIIFVLTSNRGLCGGYNNSVNRLAKNLYLSLEEKKNNIKIYASGNKAISYFKYLKLSVDKAFTDIDENVNYERITEVADELVDLYTKEKADEIYLVYTSYFSAAQQKAIVEKILPFEIEKEEDVEVEEDYRSIYIFEPDKKKVLEEILPTSIRVKVFNTVLEATLSEQIARKIAMKQASDSAGDMIKSLTLEYNRARQSKITKELIEIVGAAKVLTS